MTFFYDLNKKLKEVADSSKSEHKQLNERANSKAVAEDFGATAAIAGGAALGSALGAVKGRYDDMKYRERGATYYTPKDQIDKPRTTMQRVRAAAGFPSKNDPNVKTKEGIGDVAKKVGAVAKKVGAKALDTLGHGSDEQLRKDLQKKVGVPQTGKKPEPTKEELVGGQKKLDRNHNGKLDAEDFAMLRKGKKQTDEGDFGPMEDSTGDYSAKKARAGKDIGKPGKQFSKIAKSAGEKYGSKERGEKVAGAVLAKLRAKESAGEVEEGWDDMLKDVERRRAGMKTGEKVQGHKGEIEKTATGIKHTRKYDPKTGETDTGDDAPQGEKRRGRPKGTGKAMGAKGPSGKSKLMTKEGEHDSAEVKQAIAMLKKAGYKIEKAEEELDEKAVSKAQQRFMGMVHATQKGEKAPSKEVAKVAKSMGKKDAEDFAATKHKGLPEKKKKKTEEAGGVDTPTASSGFSFGKGIYDSINREVEEMIAESMNISMNSSSDGPNSLTVTATDEDAAYLAKILKSAGLNGGEHGGCGCGSEPCSCDQMDEAYGDTTPTENAPDYPTNTETSDDALQYAGGLNKPKSTGQTTVPVIASQEERQESYAEAEEDSIRRMMEMAGIDRSNRLDEGIMDKLKGFAVPKLMKLLGPDADNIANAVRQATGGDLTPSKENAMKVVKALGIDKAAAQSQSQMAEGIAGNWQGKLIQALYTLGLLGSAGAAASMWGTVGGSFMSVIGTLLLIFAAVFFGDAPGQVGAMGKFGNKGTGMQSGLDVHGMPVKNTNVSEDDDLTRMMEMAGVKKKDVEEEKTEEGNLFTGNLAKARAAGKKEADLDSDGDMEKVKESILDMKHLWSEYKG